MQARVHGKWILAGEHAVLRGCPALVFPMLGKHLNISYLDDGLPVRADFFGERGEELRLLFWGVIEKALAEKGSRARASLTGRFEVENGIPIGAGLGASAALCVAISRWIQSQGWASEEELYDLARGLEDLFHGESSGVDVAVALSGKGMRFVRGGARDPLSPAWVPRWCLSYSGRRGVTSECVARVKAGFESDRVRAEAIDARMRESVEEAQAALLAPGSAAALDALGSAIRKAASCFEDWGLAGGEMGDHLNRLREAGALAAKPTGSGDGGFALSLWRDFPEQGERRSLGLVSAG